MTEKIIKEDLTQRIVYATSGTYSTTSGSIPLGNVSAIALNIPSGLNGKTITISVRAHDDDTWVTLTDVPAWVAATGSYTFSATMLNALYPWAFMKIDINTAPVAAATLWIAKKS